MNKKSTGKNRQNESDWVDSCSPIFGNVIAYNVINKRREHFGIGPVYYRLVNTNEYSFNVVIYSVIGEGQKGGHHDWYREQNHYQRNEKFVREFAGDKIGREHQYGEGGKVGENRDKGEGWGGHSLSSLFHWSF